MGSRGRATRTPFVGRSAELAALERCWARTPAEGPVTAFVSGEPGIGKSALLEELLRAHHTALVARSACPEVAGPPFAPFPDLLRQIVARVGEGAVIAAAGTNASALHHLLPELGGADLDQEAPELARWRMFQALRSVLGALGRPVLLILDDLQWASRASLQLLRHLVAAPAALPVLVVGAHRPVTSGPLLDLLADLTIADTSERLRLAPLTARDVGELLTARGATGELAGATFAATGGVPLLVRLAIDELAGDAHGGGADGGDLEDIARRRAADLGREAEQTLTVAAVLGTDIDVELLAAVEGVAVDRVHDALDRAADVGLVSVGADGAPHFTHALLAEGLARNLGATRHALLNERAARALDGREGHAARAVRHWQAAGPRRDAVLAAGAARSAAEHEARRLAFEPAGELFTLGADLLEGVQGAAFERSALLASAADALASAGEHAAALELGRRAIAEAELAGDVEQLARAHLSAHDAAWSFEAVDDDGREDLERVLAALGPAGDDALRGALLARIGTRHLSAGRRELARRTLEQASAVAARSGHSFTEGFAALHLAELEQSPPADDLVGDLERMTALLRGVGRAGEGSLGMARLAVWAELVTIETHLQRCDVAAADRAISQLGEPGEEGAPLQAWAAASMQAALALREQPIDVAAALINRTLEIGRRHAEALPAWGVQTFTVLAEQDELALLESLLGAQIARTSMSAFRASLAAVLASLGRLDEADAELHALESIGLAASTRSGWLVTRVQAARACAMTGDRTIAAHLLGELDPWAGLVATYNAGADVIGAVDTFRCGLLRVLGRLDEAVEAGRAGVATSEALRSPRLAAWARRDLAMALRARDADGDAEEAARALEAVRRATDSYGLALLRRLVDSGA